MQLTPTEVAERYGYSFKTIYKWIERGVYLGAAFKKDGRRWVAHSDQLEKCECPDYSKEGFTEKVTVTFTKSQLNKLKDQCNGKSPSQYIRRILFQSDSSSPKKEDG